MNSLNAFFFYRDVCAAGTFACMTLYCWKKLPDLRTGKHMLALTGTLTLLFVIQALYHLSRNPLAYGAIWIAFGTIALLLIAMFTKLSRTRV